MEDKEVVDLGNLEMPESLTRDIGPVKQDWRESIVKLGATITLVGEFAMTAAQMMTAIGRAKVAYGIAMEQFHNSVRALGGDPAECQKALEQEIGRRAQQSISTAEPIDLKDITDGILTKLAMGERP